MARRSRLSYKQEANNGLGIEDLLETISARLIEDGSFSARPSAIGMVILEELREFQRLTGQLGPEAK